MRFVTFFVLCLLFITSTAQAAQFTESDWQVAFNNKVTHGELESEIATGRIDILTDTYAIEVDYARNYRLAIKQALQYAAETKKTPGVALIMDGKQDTVQAARAGKKLAEKAGVIFWLVNDYVSANDLTRTVEQKYWLNTKTDVRHNSRCRWFGITTNGQLCGPDEGRACKSCGG